MSYVPATPDEARQMMESIGVAGERALYADVPEGMFLGRPLNVEGGMGELGVLREMQKAACKNKVYRDIFMGAGAYRHFIPAAVDALSSRGEFVTAYTPYQAEMSQGILQSIFEYQTMICELTGMDVSNASVYDGASAAGEACLMIKDRKRNKVLVAQSANPQVVDVIRTYIVPAGMEMQTFAMTGGAADLDDLKQRLDDTVAGVYIASPNYYGVIEDVAQAAQLAHGAGAVLVCGVNPIGAAILKTPAELGADIAVGDGQPLGLPVAYGGPYLGFMACTQKLMRKMPGRIVGQTADAGGRRAFVLTLQAREQHIRREKAGSNICSNQAWCALRSAMYMTLMGKEGIREVAGQCYANAHYLKDELQKIGFAPVYNGEFFHEFVTSCPADADKMRLALDGADILGGLALPDGNILWCATELTGKDEIDALTGVLKGVAE